MGAELSSSWLFPFQKDVFQPIGRDRIVEALSKTSEERLLAGSSFSGDADKGEEDVSEHEAYEVDPRDEEVPAGPSGVELQRRVVAVSEFSF